MADSLGKRTAGEFYRLSETDQEEATARWAREQEKCPKCNNPRSECSDPEKVWYPQRAVCFATMELEAARAAFADLHKDKSGKAFHDGRWLKWSSERTNECPVPYEAGTTVYISGEDIDPGDDFTMEAEARPKAVRQPVAPAPDDEEG